MKKLRKLQEVALRTMNPTWPETPPNQKALRVLRSLKRDGLVYSDNGIWTLTNIGQRVKARLP